MSPPEQRRKHDQVPAEVQLYIDAAVEKAIDRLRDELPRLLESSSQSGSDKSIAKFMAMVGEGTFKKVVLIVGGILTLVAAWLGLGGHLPK
jgi:nucleoside phosphorylase